MSQSFTQPDLTDRAARQVGVVSITGTPPLPTGAATESTLAAINTATGATTDAEATGNGGVIGLLKRLRTLLAGGLPAALGQTTKSASLAVAIASDQDLAIKPKRLDVPFSITADAVVASTDAGDYRWVTVQITAQANNPITTAQTSLDGTTWVSHPLFSAASLTSGSPTANLSAAGLYHGPLLGRYFRLNVAGISSGTHTGIVSFDAAPAQLHAHSVAAVQSGTWTVQPGNTANTTAWKTDGSAVTQPVSASSLPLPTGAATETTLAAINTATGAQADSAWISGSGSIIALLKAIAGKFPALVSGRFPVDGSGVTQPVSAASLPLPTGAATESTLGDVDNYVTKISTATGALADAAWTSGSGSVIAVLKAIAGKFPALVSGRFPVDPSGVTSPVSLASVPLPTGAATETTLSAVSTATGAQADAAWTSGSGSLIALLKAIAGKFPALVSGRFPVDPSGVTSPISAASLPLPTGAATEATLAALSAKLPSVIGQQHKAASLSVTLPDNPDPVPITATSLPLPTGAATETTLAALNTATGAQADGAWASGSGSIIAILKGIFGRFPALVSGRFPVDPSGVTSPVSAASLPLPTGAATETTLADVDNYVQRISTATGAQSDAEVSSGAGSVIALLKRLRTLLSGGLPAALGLGNGLKADLNYPLQDTTASGNLTALNQTLGLTTTGDLSTVLIQLSGTWVGSVAFEGSVDGANFISISAVSPTDSTYKTVASANGIWAIPAGPYYFVRVRCSAYTSGTIAVTLRGGHVGTAAVLLGQALPNGTNSIGGVTEADGANVALGSTADGATATTVIGRFQKLISLFPTALGGNGGLKIEGISGGQAVPISAATLPSHPVTNAGTFAVQDSQKVVDNAAFTDGTTPVQPGGYILDETAGTALTENDIGAARMDSKRAQVMVFEDATTRGQRAAVNALGMLSVQTIAPANLATSQVALTTSAASVAVARTTRLQVTIRNLDTAISVYVGASGVLATTGMLLKAGESVDVFTTAAVFAVAASGTPSVAVLDQYY